MPSHVQACCGTGADHLAVRSCARPLRLLAFVSQGLGALRGHGSQSLGAAFLQRRSQSDSAVRISIAGVGQPGKSVSRRVGRLAQKWCFLSSPVQLLPPIFCLLALCACLPAVCAQLPFHVLSVARLRSRGVLLVTLQVFVW